MRTKLSPRRLRQISDAVTAFNLLAAAFAIHQLALQVKLAHNRITSLRRQLETSETEWGRLAGYLQHIRKTLVSQHHAIEEVRRSPNSSIAEEFRAVLDYWRDTKYPGAPLCLNSRCNSGKPFPHVYSIKWCRYE